MFSLRQAYRARSTVVIVLALALTVGPLGSIAQGQQKEEQVLSNEQLEQLASPIALYPDSLLSQILMAATYPLEVVEAARWQKTNEKLEGEALAKALEKQSWDPSVKSLINFPEVLTMMNERLSWILQLGNAVLGQQKELMDAVQRLRVKANKAGNLKTTTQQTVVVEKEIIKIVPAKTEVIYVPAYNPVVVYGTWAYPTYPPPPAYYPPGYVAGAAIVGFAAGVACSQAWGYSWGHCNWNSGDIDIDVKRNTEFNGNIDRERNQTRERLNNRGGEGGRGNWNHDPSHRKGVGYSDRKTAQRFDRGGDARRQQSREQFRGRTGSGRSDSARSGFDRTGRGNTGRTGGPDAGRTGSGRTGTGRSDVGRTGSGRTDVGRSGSSRSGSNRSTTSRSGSSRSGGAFGGSRSGSSSRSNASRGFSSRSSSGMSRSMGSRSRGGRSGGGGRR